MLQKLNTHIHAEFPSNDQNYDNRAKVNTEASGPPGREPGSRCSVRVSGGHEWPGLVKTMLFT